MFHLFHMRSTDFLKSGTSETLTWWKLSRFIPLVPLFMCIYNIFKKSNIQNIQKIKKYK